MMRCDADGGDEMLDYLFQNIVHPTSILISHTSYCTAEKRGG